MLKEKSLGVFLCTPCTLNCRLCGAHVPLYKERGVRHFEPPEICCEGIKEAFRVFDYAETLSLTGGEPLLHPHLPEIVSFALQNYSSQFGQLRITTNGTLLPSELLLQTIRNYADDNVLFVLDNYGDVSKRIADVEDILKENHISYRINQYCGENQHCGGWIDFGPPNQNRGYSSAEAQHIVEKCHAAQWRCLNIFKGKIYLCAHQIAGSELGCFDMKPDEYIDLRGGGGQTLEEKKKIAARLGSKPIQACYYCNGFDPETAPRFPAGEQI